MTTTQPAVSSADALTSAAALAAEFAPGAARRDADVAASAQPAQQVPAREPDPRVDAPTTQFERAPVEPEPTPSHASSTT